MIKDLHIDRCLQVDEEKISEESCIKREDSIILPGMHRQKTRAASEGHEIGAESFEDEEEEERRRVGSWEAGDDCNG